ncbi:MAG: ABC transporter substrate-binding protein [Candidatus Limiplasma sp.]|nr:ABC transporter substrate-binding protein [Candidatus Limiplasma sp.]
MKKLASLLLALCLLLSLATYASAEASADLPVLRVAVMPFYISSPTYYIVQNGLDVANGFKIDLQFYPMGAPQIEAMAANEWDVGMMGSAGVFGVANAGMMIVSEVVLSSGGTGAYVRPDSPIAQVTDGIPAMPGVYGNAETMKGATVLVPVGSLNHLNVVKWYYAAGLSVDDFTVVDMSNANSFQAFKAGEGDITAFSPPLTYQAEEEGWVKASGLDSLNCDAWDCLYANPRTYEDTKELIAKFVDVLLDVQTEFSTNQELASEWGYKWLHDENGMTNTTLQNLMDEWAVRPFRTREEVENLTVLGESLKELAAFYGSIGNLDPARVSIFENPRVVTMEVLDMVFGRN